MSKIASSRCIGAFALLLALATPALAQYDTDPLVNGLPCNALCRWWLGVPSSQAEPAKADPRIETEGKNARKSDPRSSRTQSGSGKQAAPPPQRASAPATGSARSKAADKRLEPPAPKMRRDERRQASVVGRRSQLTPRHNHLVSLRKAAARADRRVAINALDTPAEPTKVTTADANQPNSPASAQDVSNGILPREAEQPAPNLALSNSPSGPGPAEIEQASAPPGRHDANATQQLASTTKPEANAAAAPSTDGLSAILVTRREIGNVAELANLTLAIDGTLASAEETIREAFFAASGASIVVDVKDADSLKRLNDGEADAAVIGLVSSAAAEASLDGYSVFLLNLRPR